MTRISFYLLPDASGERRANVACRLAEKAYRLGHGVYLHCPDADRARELDDRLWQFRDGAFVPHVRAEDDDRRAPVLIGHAPEPDPRVTDVLINLTGEVPGFFGRFRRLVELVQADDAERARARERFRFYRDRGYELETHELPAGH